MLIGSRQRVGGKTLCLSLNGSLLKQVSSTKYLGVCIDQYLTWQNHLCSKNSEGKDLFY